MQRRAVAIVNPATGSAGAEQINTLLIAAAARHDVELTISHTSASGDAQHLAALHATNADILVAVGGDGTVSDVIAGSLGVPVKIGIVPTGSTNMIAKELGLPRSLSEAADIALGSRNVIRTDVARAGERICVHMAGAGFDAAIMQDANLRLKRRVGWIAYLLPAIRHLRYPSFRVDIELDGVRRSREARLVLCAIGGSIISRRFRIGEGIDRTDGLLDVCVWNPPGVIAFLTCLGWVAVSRPGKSRWLRQARGKRVVLSADRNVQFEIDGDSAGMLPATVEMLPTHVAIVVG